VARRRRSRLAHAPAVIYGRGMTLRICGLALVLACSSPPPPTRPAPPPSPPVTGEPPPPPAPPPDANATFDALVAEFLDGYLKLSPVDATTAGEHRFDGTWPDMTPAGDAATLAFDARIAERLAKIPRASLDPQHAIDADILDDELRYDKFAFEQLKARDTDPMVYTGVLGEGLDPLVNRSFGSKESRSQSLRGRLDGIAAVVAAAKQRLGHSAKVQTETAIAQVDGLIGLVDGDLAKNPDLAEAAKHASAALHDFSDFLNKNLLPRSDGSFRLGREKFATKLAFVLADDIDIDQIAAGARELLQQTQADMVGTAKEVWALDKMGKLPPLDTPARKKAFVKQVLDHVAKEHSTNKTILADAKKWLDLATGFVRDHDLVRVPDEPVAVVEMPEYRRGTSVAYCDSSGPLEPQPETFYAISPTPKDWPKSRVDSFYREYNQSMLAELSIHEAMPGHYLQGMHNNKFASKLRAVFASGPFVEGWAVYGEWLMASKGFGGPKVRLQREKMVLRLAANAILDHDIHAGNMEEKDALALMTNEAFQEEGEAVGKWKRARLSSAQLTTYYYGFVELLKMRKQAEAQQGFSERAYHDRLLSWGSPGMKYVRRLLAMKP
jgi:uncharacterized protein (DUF885 family)